MYTIKNTAVKVCDTTVARAAPATPQPSIAIKHQSIHTFKKPPAASTRNGVLESPMALKIPAHIL